ncbi:glycosyltransferase [Aeromonas hydrophila]|uniref:glycosyltransferase n=1 Tax=Aeromonas hydrophila TaxID=644 RepID=UPI003670617E
MLEMEELVTVAVISYNSEQTIIETLNSINHQTYNKKSIEIIISDDGSSDNTLSISEEWKKIHVEKFYAIRIVSHNKNKGVTANCNQAWKLATGSWIKTIAADDLLLPDCIALNINYSLYHPDTNVLFSNMISFNQLGQEETIKHDLDKMLCSRERQYINILTECYLFAPTSFIKKKAIIDIGYGDEAYPMIEDYPLWLKFLTKGYKLDYLNKETVRYRKGDTLSQQETKIGNVIYFKSLYSFQKEKIWPLLPSMLLFKKWDDSVLFYQRVLWIKLFGNKINVPYYIYNKSLFLIRPYRVYKYINNAIKKARL